MGEALLGGRRLAGILLYSVPGSFEVGLFVALLLFLVLRIVLRKQWLAAIAYVLLYIALVALSDPSIVSGVFSALSIVILVTVLIRYGLLAVVTMIMVSAILYSTTLTPDLSAWYASSGLVGAALVVALAGCGFYTSLAGRPLFRKGWLPDEG